MKRIIYNNKHRILKLYYSGVPPSILLREYRIPSSTFYSWVKKNPKEVIAHTSSDAHLIEYYRLHKHCEKIESALAFLSRTVVKYIPLRDKLEIIDQEYGKESLHIQCEALSINRATYLNRRYRSKKDSAWFKRRRAEYEGLIKEIYEASGHVYGAKKIAAIMRSRGKTISDKYTRKLMSELGLRSNRSSSDKDYYLVARHLREAKHSSQEFKPDGINQVWVSDTSAILVHNRYYYICIYIDLYSRKVVSWGIGRNNSARLVKHTFLDAYTKRRPKVLTVHTDNGSCYTGYSFEQALRKHYICHSYSRPHIPHDNAVAESFFNTLKREGIFLQGYPKSLRDLEQNVAKYIKHYNSNRPHEHLNYLSPDQFEQKN